MCLLLQLGTPWVLASVDPGEGPHEKLVSVDPREGQDEGSVSVDPKEGQNGGSLVSLSATAEEVETIDLVGLLQILVSCSPGPLVSTTFVSGL